MPNNREKEIEKKLIPFRFLFSFSFFLLYLIDNFSLIAAFSFFFWLNLINLGVLFSLKFFSPKIAILIRSIDFLTLFFVASMVKSSIMPYSYFLFPLPIFLIAFQVGTFGCIFFTVFTILFLNFIYLFTQSPYFFKLSLFSSPLPSLFLALNGAIASSLSLLFQKESFIQAENFNKLKEKAERYAGLDKIIGVERHFENESMLFKFILKKLKPHLKAKIFYLKKAEDKLTIAAASDEKDERLVGLSISEQSWIYQAFNSRSSSCFPSPGDELKQEITEPFKNSFLLLSPILEENEVLGAFLAVREYGKSPFSFEELEFSGIASHHFRALIKEAEIRENLKKSVTELSAIAKIAEASISTLSLEELLEVSLKTTAEALHAHSGSIFLEKNGDLQLVKTYNLKIKPYLLSKGKEQGNEISRIASREKKFLHLVNPLPPQFKSLHPEITDSLVLPLLVKDEFIGILCLNNQTPRQYTENEVKTALTIANELALAIKTALLYQETLEKSLTDQLTGLRNHAYFWERLEEEVKRASRSKKALSILIFDLDNFKIFNDTYGHLKGDEILKEVGKIIKETTRGSDIAARYGGDEFAIIMPETAIENSIRLAKRLANKINKINYGNFSLTLSIGIASFPEHGKTAAELIEQADLALYSIKRQGKGGVRVASERRLE